MVRGKSCVGKTHALALISSPQRDQCWSLIAFGGKQQGLLKYQGEVRGLPLFQKWSLHQAIDLPLCAPHATCFAERILGIRPFPGFPFFCNHPSGQLAGLPYGSLSDLGSCLVAVRGPNNDQYLSSSRRGSLLFLRSRLVRYILEDYRWDKVCDPSHV